MELSPNWTVTTVPAATWLPAVSDWEMARTLPELLEVVPQGKRPMTGQEWAAGRRLKKGDFLRPEV